MDRRRFIDEGVKAAILLSTVGLSDYSVVAQEQISEVESGDPDAPSETLTIQTQAIKKLYGKATGPLKNAEQIAKKTLDIALGYVGVSRATNPTQVEQFLNLFGLHIKYANGSVVPFCASGIGFSVCRAYIEMLPIDPRRKYEAAKPVTSLRKVLADVDKHYFRPHPACREMVHDASTRGKWIGKTPGNLPAPGWLVFYDWDRDSVPNHVGIVERSEPDVLHTVEFNTSIATAGSQSNGGAVARKQRKYDHVLGYIKTY